MKVKEYLSQGVISVIRRLAENGITTKVRMFVSESNARSLSCGFPFVVAKRKKPLQFRKVNTKI